MLFHVCVFDPSNVYLNGEVSTQVAGDPYFYYAENAEVGHNVRPTVGRLEVGVYVPFSRSLVLRYAVEHTSAINLGDRGEERAVLGFEWRPFR
jgi:hypothetical protein